MIETLTSRVGGIPYVGPRPLTRHDAPKFFGRDAESRELADLWQGHRLTVLHGAPGSGRTSLIEAGSRPLLRPDLVDVLPTGRLSYRSLFPVAALPEHNPYTLALLSSWSPSVPANRVAGWSITEFLNRRTRPTDALGRRLPLLIVIDQAEEFFAGHPYAPERDEDRRAFIDELAGALDEHHDLRLMVSIRDRLVPSLMPYAERLGGGDVARMLLPSFDTASALEALHMPLRSTGRWYADGAAEALVEDLRAGTPAVEPLFVQIVGQSLWQSLPDELRIITADEALRHGDAPLGTYVARMLADVADQYDIPVAELRSWMARVFSADRTEPARDGEMPAAVLRAMEDRHLIRSSAHGHELQHPRLLTLLQRLPATTPSAFGPAERLRDATDALASGEFARAERQAATAVRIGPKSDLRLRAEAESLLGNIAHGRGLRHEAETHYQTAASLFDARQDKTAVGRLLAAIGRLRLADGRHAEALQELHAAAERLPGDVTVQAELAWALWQLGYARGAVTLLDGVLSAEGDAPEILRARGELLADLGDAEGALRDLDRVRLRLPARTRAARALALATLRRYEPAQEEIDAVLAEAPGNGPVLLYAARVASLRGQTEAADDLVRRADAATDPALPSHQRGSARLLPGHRPDDPRRAS